MNYADLFLGGTTLCSPVVHRLFTYLINGLLAPKSTLPLCIIERFFADEADEFFSIHISQFFNQNFEPFSFDFSIC